MESQERLRERLAQFGVASTQATLSRDIRAIGVFKGPDGYHLPGVTPEPENRVHATFGAGDGAVGAYAIDVVPAGTLVIVHTAPGHAQVVALELDRYREPPVIGTVGGDDTVFVATPSVEKALEVAEILRKKAGLEPLTEEHLGATAK